MTSKASKIAMLKRLANLEGNLKVQADACARLADVYRAGVDGVEKDEKEEVKWLIKSSEFGFAGAQYNLGVCYEQGKGVAQSFEKAVELYQKAADQNHPLAQSNLGVCYSQGEGVAQNKEKAFEWYQKAADQGFALAQRNIASCYYDGMGVKRSLKKSFVWYRKAANRGDFGAQFSLAQFYHKGLGVVVKNPEKAKLFYELAASQGFAPARTLLAQLEAETGKGADKL